MSDALLNGSDLLNVREQNPAVGMMLLRARQAVQSLEKERADLARIIVAILKSLGGEALVQKDHFYYSDPNDGVLVDESSNGNIKISLKSSSGILTKGLEMRRAG